VKGFPIWDGEEFCDEGGFPEGGTGSFGTGGGGGGGGKEGGPGILTGGGV
jgi:hypothetical protein